MANGRTLYLVGAVYFMIILTGSADGAYKTICDQPRCEYFFSVRHARTMTYHARGATYNVAMNGTRLVIAENSLRPAGSTSEIGREVSPDDVITLDGIPATVITINNQFPGPTIEVMEGSEVVVHVTNDMHRDCTTIHWHGIHQEGTNYMDGAAYVTQCPILPHQTFTYRFTASPAGTHWYHSHLSNQRTEGLFGTIIVHNKLTQTAYFPLMIQDWFEINAREKMIIDPWVLPRRYRGAGDMNLPPEQREYGRDGVQLSAYRGYTGLINGRGRSGDLHTPLTQIGAGQGETIRLRLLNTGAEFAWQISVDQHQIKVVASDGYEIASAAVDFVTIEPGETIDVELTADGETGNYWVRARTLRAGVGWFPEDSDGQNVEVKAIFRYHGALVGEPTTEIKSCDQNNPCLVFNCNFHAYADKYHSKCIHYTDVRSTYSQQYLQDNYGILDTDYEEIFLNFAFPIGSSVNARRHLVPKKPLITDGTQGNHVTACDESKCNARGCACTHILNLAYNKTVQLVLANLVPEGQPTFAHHPIHIHGVSFVVMATGYPDMNRTTGHWSAPNPDILCESRLCAQGRWRHAPPEINNVNPVVKDTIVTPARGYTVIRFRTTNPGYWFVHCHAEQHVSNGMNMIFNIGPGHHVALPDGFPRCSNFDVGNDYRSNSYSAPVTKGTTRNKQGQGAREHGDVHNHDNIDTDNHTQSQYSTVDCSLCSESFAFSVIQMIGVIFGSAVVGGFCLMTSYMMYNKHRIRQQKRYCNCPCEKQLRPLNSKVRTDAENTSRSHCRNTKTQDNE